MYHEAAPATQSGCTVSPALQDGTHISSHITPQPKSGHPLKLSRVEPGQYLDGRSPGKTRFLLEEVLVRPAGGAHPVLCVGPNAPVLVMGHYTVNILQMRCLTEVLTLCGH